MQDLSFSLLQALHLVALLPCLFVVALLVMLHGASSKILVPCLFFFALGASFMLGLLPVFFPHWYIPAFGLIWLESLQPALCFLLIIQLWRNQTPQALYWLILSVPILGGTSLVVGSMVGQQLCLVGEYCLKSNELRHLYQFFATAFIFLLLIVHLGRISLAAPSHARYESHRYWLIIALIIAYTALMLTDLATLTRHISVVKHDYIHVVLRIAFIYLVVTSLFRLFDTQNLAQQSEGGAAASKPIDASLLARIEAILMQEKLYREMNFNREQFAKKLDVAEHVLSRAINQALGKNFNELVNGYRIDEAKQRLVSEATSVTAIAFEVGFSSIASFNRVFKAMVGRSPTEYRQTNQS